MSQGSDDGHALAGANSEGDLAASENSVVNILLLDEAVRVAIRRSKRTIPMMKIVEYRDHRDGDFFCNF